MNTRTRHPFQDLRSTVDQSDRPPQTNDSGEEAAAAASRGNLHRRGGGGTLSDANPGGGGRRTFFPSFDGKVFWPNCRLCPWLKSGKASEVTQHGAGPAFLPFLNQPWHRCCLERFTFTHSTKVTKKYSVRQCQLPSKSHTFPNSSVSGQARNPNFSRRTLPTLFPLLSVLNEIYSGHGVRQDPLLFSHDGKERGKRREKENSAFPLYPLSSPLFQRNVWEGINFAFTLLLLLLPCF